MARRGFRGIGGALADQRFRPLRKVRVFCTLLCLLLFVKVFQGLRGVFNFFVHFVVMSRRWVVSSGRLLRYVITYLLLFCVCPYCWMFVVRVRIFLRTLRTNALRPSLSMITQKCTICFHAVDVCECYPPRRSKSVSCAMSGECRLRFVQPSAQRHSYE